MTSYVCNCVKQKGRGEGCKIIIYTWSLGSICLARRTGILNILREPKAWRCTCKKMCHGKRAYTAIHYHINSERCLLCPIKMGPKRRDTNTKRNVTLHHIIWLHRRKGYGVDDCKTFTTIGFVGALRFINFVKSSIRFRSTHLTMWCCRSPTEPEIARIWAHCGWPIAKVAIFFAADSSAHCASLIWWKVKYGSEALLFICDIASHLRIQRLHEC